MLQSKGSRRVGHDQGCYLTGRGVEAATVGLPAWARSETKAHNGDYQPPHLRQAL